MTSRADDLDPAGLAAVVLLLGKVGVAVNRRLAAALEAVELRPKHLGALAVLTARGEVSQQALGEGLGVDPSAVVAIVDDLERDGLASRVRDPADRRRRLISITAQGSRVLAAGHDVVAQLDDQLLAGMDRAERLQLVGLLLRVAATDPELMRLLGSGAITAPDATGPR